MHREQALDSLVAAEDIRARVRRGGRWYTVWALAFAGMSVVLMLGVGFLGATSLFEVFMSGWALVFLVMLGYALRRPVTPAGFGWVHGLGMAGWGVLYAVIVVIGQVYFPSQPVWWIPGAMLSAVPLLVVALVVRTRSQEVA